jgi:hypothetical protein
LHAQLPRYADPVARQTRIRIIAAAVLAAVVIGVIVGVSIGKSSGSDSAAEAASTSARAAATSASSVRTAGDPLPGTQNGAPPWPANGDQLADRLKAIGLPALPAEGTVVHIHQHIDVLFEGQRVPLAANTGIDPNGQFISPLHTHDATGIIHVESPTVRTFTLGQFFDVWGVSLSASEIGGQSTGDGNILRAWVNGLRVKGDPAKVQLVAHQEIVVAYGTPAQMPKHVPSTYQFPQGL